MSHPEGRSEATRGKFEEDRDADEPVTVTDKRRIDPETGEVREGFSGAAPAGAAPGAVGSPQADQIAELTADLQRVQADFANYRKGDLDGGPLKSVADKLAGVLTGLGLLEFGAEGEEFDPSLHEAVQHEGDGSNPVIGHVMRKGYKFGDQILRHALVGVVDTVVGTDTAESHSASDQ